jgi:peptide deformylase
MAIRKIGERGDPILEKVCRPVTDFNARLHTLLDDMAETLAESGGVGLAAPQVGILRRVCIVEDSEGEIIELINPEIVSAEGEQTGLEGCLSIPGRFGIVTRPYKVRVRAQDREGATFEIEDEMPQEVVNAGDVSTIINKYLETYDHSDDNETWFNKIRAITDELGYAVKPKDYKKHPEEYKGHVGHVSTVIRVALMGRQQSPDIWEIQQILGEERVRARLQKFA